jgi:predicted metal-dependent peptidase
MSNVDKQLMRVKKAHITLMKHPETALYSGVMLMGKSDVSEGSFTAYTDGVNKRYCADYLETLKDESLIRGVVLHENLHVALKHIPRGREMFKEHRRMANMAVDFVVNDIITNIKGTVQGTKEAIVKVHDTWIYDPMFHNWSVKEVWDYLKKNAKKSPPPPQGQGGDPCDNPTSKGDSKDSPPDKPRPQYESVEVGGKEYDLSDDGDGGGDFDEHDWESFIEGLTPDELKELGKKIDDGLRQGGILAGRMGGKIPRAITDMLEPKIDWREALRDFVSSSKRGSDEFTWRKMNKRQLANDMYMPSMEDERMGEVIFGIDTSGSIIGETLNLFASELALSLIHI